MKEARLAIRMPDEEFEEFKALCERKGVSMTERARMHIRNDIEADAKERGITKTFDAEQA